MNTIKVISVDAAEDLLEHAQAICTVIDEPELPWVTYVTTAAGTEALLVREYFSPKCLLISP